MSDTIDRILGTGASFDWISPLVSLIQDTKNGRGHDFFLDLYAGYSVNDVKRLFRRHGIKVWGDMIMDGMIVVTVRKPQARWAQFLLEREGMPLVGGRLQQTGNFTARPAPQPSPNAGDDLATRVDRWLDALFS